jgi:hypothetical protein
MDDNIKQKLEVEGAIGENHQRVWDSMVLPFFDAKHAELYEVFKQCPVRDKDALVEIHAQILALESMKDHFMTFIQTGQLARKQLAIEEEKNEKL